MVAAAVAAGGGGSHGGGSWHGGGDWHGGGWHGGGWHGSASALARLWLPLLLLGSGLLRLPVRLRLPVPVWLLRRGTRTYDDARSADVYPARQRRRRLRRAAHRRSAASIRTTAPTRPATIRRSPTARAGWLTVVPNGAPRARAGAPLTGEEAMNAIKRYVPLTAALLLGACVTVPTGAQRRRAAGQQQELRSVPGRYLRLPAVRAAVGRRLRRAGEQLRGVECGRRHGASAPPRARSSDRHPATRALARRSAPGRDCCSAARPAATPTARGYYQIQRRYDGAYMQCMYAKGNQIPVRGPARYRAPPPAYYGPPAG